MIFSVRSTHLGFLLAIGLLASGILQGATIPFNGTSKRRANEDIEHPEIGSHIIYVSPLPDSKYVTPESNIIIRADENLIASSIRSKLFNVVGSQSGQHDGKVILSSDQRTVVFQPQTPFALGETVSVSLNHGFLSVGGDSILPAPFLFTISKSHLNSYKEFLSNIDHGYPESVAPTKQQGRLAGVFSGGLTKDTMESLPSDFPILSVTNSSDPTPGYIFIASNINPATQQQYGNYLIVADNNGNPIFYRNTGAAPGWNFTLQPTGVLTYSYNYNGLHYIMNTSFHVIDSVTCGNGYLNDTHEIRILPNGNIFLLADDWETMDMSKIVPGGDTNATVLLDVVQELDPNGNVIFEWRTIDHLKMTDAINQDLTQPQIDPFHCNAIEIDPDGNILVSIRYLCAIIKINVVTGDIIWQLGGNKNQFNIVDDPIGFYYQHSIRRLPNGDITLFDNGNFHSPRFSRAVEYKLDDVNMTATLVWQYTENERIFGEAMGYVQRLPNGNTFIGWGYLDNQVGPAVTEVTPDGSVVFEMSMPYNVFSYRAYRLPFLFITSPTSNDTLSAERTATLRWESSGIDSINIDYSTDGGVSWSNMADNYSANADSINFSVPSISGPLLQFRISDTTMVDEYPTYVTYKSDSIVVGSPSAVKPSAIPYSFYLSNNYPNPFNPTTLINYEVAKNTFVTLKVYDVLGREVATLVSETKSAGEYSAKFDGSRFPSGVYFYRLSTSSGFLQVKKMVLEK